MTGIFMVAFCSSAFWMRRSMSRTASRYSVSLARSPEPSLVSRRSTPPFTKSRMLLRSCMRRQARGGVGAVAVAEQALEQHARIHFHRDSAWWASARRWYSCRRSYSRSRSRRRGWALPRRFRARRTESLAQLPRRDLIGRNAGVDVGAFGLLRMHAGQPRGARARVVAAAVAERAAVDLRQVAEHQHLVAERLKRLHRGVELEARAFGRRAASPPR